MICLRHAEYSIKYLSLKNYMCIANYSRTPMARTPLEPWKYIRDRCSSSYGVLIIVPGQGYLFDFL